MFKRSVRKSHDVTSMVFRYQQNLCITQISARPCAQVSRDPPRTPSQRVYTRFPHNTTRQLIPHAFSNSPFFRIPHPRNPHLRVFRTHHTTGTSPAKNHNSQHPNGGDRNNGRNRRRHPPEQPPEQPAEQPALFATRRPEAEYR